MRPDLDSLFNHDERAVQQGEIAHGTFSPGAD